MATKLVSLGRSVPCALLALWVLGCSASSQSVDGSAANLTADNGAKYVVRADASHVVLRKVADGRPLPVGPGDLTGKLILIHPLPGVAETGVFSWARSVKDAGDTLEIDAEPCGVDELATLREDQIVRIYEDSTIPKFGDGAPSTVSGATVGSLLPTTEGDIRPLGFDGALLGKPVQVKNIPFGAVAGFVGTIVPTVSDFVLDPRLVIGVDHGLEFGARLHFETDVSVALKGRIQVGAPAGGVVAPAGQAFTFLDQEQTVVDRWVIVPIAGVPVPFNIGLSFGARCSAIVGVALETSLQLHIGLDAGGSFVFDPQGSSDLSTAFKAGSVPNHLDGNGSIGFGGITLDPAAGLNCQFPRVTLGFGLPGDVAKVYVAVSAVTAVGDATIPNNFSAQLAAGVSGQVLGHSAHAELVLVRWMP
jgi:hypothetical protein